MTRLIIQMASRIEVCPISPMVGEIEISLTSYIEGEYTIPTTRRAMGGRANGKSCRDGETSMTRKSASYARDTGEASGEEE